MATVSRSPHVYLERKGIQRVLAPRTTLFEFNANPAHRLPTSPETDSGSNLEETFSTADTVQEEPF